MVPLPILPVLRSPNQSLFPDTLVTNSKSAISPISIEIWATESTTPVCTSRIIGLSNLKPLSTISNQLDEFDIA